MFFCFLTSQIGSVIGNLVHISKIAKSGPAQRIDFLQIVKSGLVQIFLFLKSGLDILRSVTLSSEEFLKNKFFKLEVEIPLDLGENKFQKIPPYCENSPRSGGKML